MKEQLEAIGFDKREAEIYIVLSKLGKATVTELMKHTEIERRSIYDVLERLVQKGRTSFVEENGTRVYSPISPDIILADLKHQGEEFEKVIPQLKSLEEPQTAKVEVLKGKKGLMAIFHEIIESGELHCSWGDLSPLIFEKEYDRIVKKFLNEVEKRGMGEKIIYAKGEPINKIKKGEYKAVDKKDIPPTPTLIYGDVTTHYIYTTPLTIIKISSKDITKTNRQYFEEFWNKAK